MASKFLARAQDFIKFVNNSRSAFHAVASVKQRLLSAGFVEISERTSFNVIKPGGRYFYTRNQSSIVAFAVGKLFKPGNGFNCVGAHTDSPVLKVKPVSNIQKSGFIQVGVEPYGGGLWYTWFDRDLTVAGRVIVATASGFESRLVYIDKPLMCIPSLAIHLDRSVSEAFKFNTETNLLPILETSIKAQLQTAGEPHNGSLVNLIAKTLGVNKSVIQGFELTVCAHQDSVIGGINDEFIFSPRIDNLVSSFCALQALCETSSDESLSQEENVRVLLLFDNEEVGSCSAHGAQSPMLNEAMERIIGVLKGSATEPDLMHITRRKSFVISADMAHAIHPNYSDKHETNHRPEMHKGPVIKFNANQRYATTSETAFVIENLAKKHSIPIQKFAVRNDSPCGSTIGPILSGETGIRTVDIGNPQLAMHSIRETCGVDDTTYCIDLLKAFYSEFTALDKSLKID